MKNIFIALGLLILLPFTLHAAAGANSAEFLNIVPDPKITALGGGAFGEASNLPPAAFNNPASLFGTNRPWLSLSYLAYPGDIQYHFASFATPTSYGTIGGSVGFLSYNDIPGYDNNGQPMNIDGSYDMFFMMSYAIPLRTSLPIIREHGALGVNVKVIESKLTAYSSEAIAMDAGGVFNVPYVEGLTAGVSYKNLGSDLKYVARSMSLPSSLNFGLAYRNPELRGLFTTLDYSMPDKGEAALSAGLSISPVYFLTLRGGYRTVTDSGLMSDIRTGFGLQFGDFNLDYSFTPFTYFSPVHALSLSLAIGSILKLETASDFYLEKHFHDACDAYYRKDYIEARQQFEEILSVYPDHYPSQHLLGKIMEAIGKDEEMKEKKIAALLTKAEAASTRRDFVAARHYYQAVLAVNPDDEQARVGLEKNWQMLEDVKEEKARRKAAKEIDQIWTKAMRHYQKGDFVLAKSEFNDILQLDPENENAKQYIVEIDNQLSKVAASTISELYTKASEYYKAGNYQEAIKYFEAVLVASPRRLDAQDFIARCKGNIAEQQEKERAGQLAKDQVRMKEEMESTYNKALKYYEKGSYKLALDYFQRSEELANRYEYKDYSDNVRNYISMLKTSLAEDCYRRGFEYVRKNRLEAAAEEYRQAVTYNPENASARVELQRIGKDLAQQYYERGMAYFSKAEMLRAREMFQKSLSYDPDKIESRRALDRIR